MDFLSFLLSKHVDHNHFLVYLFSWLDATFAGGSMWVLTVGQTISHLAFFSFCVYVIRLQCRNKYLVLVCIVFCASQVFSIYGMELWVFPFQFVLASFRALFVIGFLLFCKALFEPSKRQRAFLWYMPVLLVASLSHGSGILVPVAVLVALAFARWVTPLRLNRIEWVLLIIFFLAFAAHSYVFPSQAGFTKILHWIRAEEWSRVPIYMSFLLGHAFAWSAPYKVQVFAGALGIIAYLALLVYFFVKRFGSGLNIGLAVVGGFYLGSAVLSVLMNLGYVDFRGVKDITPEYFLSSRYLATTSGFWLSLLFMGLAWLATISRSQARVVAALSIAACLLASSYSSLRIQNFDAKQNFCPKEGWKDLLLFQAMCERSIRSQGYGPEIISLQQFSKCFLIPFEAYSAGLQALDIAKEQKLGIFSPSRHDLDAPDRTPLPFTDANWARGVSRSRAMIVVANTKSNQNAFALGNVIHFLSGPRVIQGQQAAGIYLWVSLAGAVLDPALDGHPKLLRVEQLTENEKKNPSANVISIRKFSFLTDENWINGVARHWAGFFLPNTPENYSRFQVGKIVKCANGEEREIIKAEPSGAYLNIFLNGPILDPNLCGRPDSYTVK